MIKNRFFFVAGETASIVNTLFTAGSNGTGRTGLGTSVGNTTVTTQVGTDTDWAIVSSGSNHTVAVKNDGTLWVWGFDGQGELGRGVGAGSVLNPLQIGSDTDWRTVSAGGNCSFAIKQNGSLWATGANTNGQTGLGLISGDTITWTQVGSDLNWSTISAGSGGQQTLAVKTDGRLYSWGNNANGVTGQGLSTGLLSTPTQVGSDTNWLSANTGNQHSVAIKTNGTIYGFGPNLNGATGQGINTGNTLTPTQIQTDTDWIDIKAGAGWSLALKNNGTMWSFGANSLARTGQGTIVGELLVPTQIGTDTDWALLVDLFVVSATGFAIKENGSLWVWGSDASGITGLGLGVLLVPTSASADIGWKYVSSGGASFRIRGSLA